jgi:hypothetical protein
LRLNSRKKNSKAGEDEPKAHEREARANPGQESSLDGEKVAGSGLGVIGHGEVLKKTSAKPENQYSTDDKEERGASESRLDAEGAPQGADEEAGGEVAYCVHCRERAEGHAVLFFGDKLGGEGVFERFFRADVKTRQDKNHRE